MLRSRCALTKRKVERNVFRVVATTLVLGGVAVAAGRPSTAQLQAAANQARETSGVPGLVFALVDADEVVTVASGLRAAGPATPTPMEPTDEVHIGSNFKAMTATVIGRLVDRGLLSWETTLAEVFPELVGTANPASLGVTVRQLVAHRGGLDDQASYALLEGLEEPTSGRAARAAAIPAVLAAPPQLPVGGYTYSNLGYALAGGVVERLLGVDFESAVQAELAGPLGMTTLAVGAPGVDDFANVAGPLGHDASGVPTSPTDQALPYGLEPAGAYRVTIDDWTKFVRQQMGLSTGADPLISPLTLTEIHQPVGDALLEDGTGYALGWITALVEGEDVIFHNGSNTFWYSLAVVNTRLDRAILFAGNQQDSGAVASEMLYQQPEIRAWLLGAAAVPEPNGIVGIALLAWIVVAIARRGVA